MDSFQVARMRQAAESRMGDWCRVSRGGGSPVLDETTGEYGASAPTITYDGPCEVEVGATAPRTIDAAGQALVLQQSTLKLPVMTSTQVAESDTVEVITSATDPALVGRRFRITGPFAGTYTTARRFPIEEVA